MTITTDNSVLQRGGLLLDRQPSDTRKKERKVGGGTTCTNDFWHKNVGTGKHKKPKKKKEKRDAGLQDTDAGIWYDSFELSQYRRKG